MSQTQALLDAYNILTHAYRDMLADNTAKPIRLFLLGARNHVETQLKQDMCSVGERVIVHKPDSSYRQMRRALKL